MYWNSILWFLSWPVLVVATYYLVKFTIRKYEPILEKPLKKAHPEKQQQ
ncbi:MAG: hypothetical protein JNL03_05125 [Prolixibacteraceae bacterium]|nr:hypothetical protein [Prolixibacteraceae bacterium]